MIETLRVVDSHTEGEPTRVVIGGWPALEGATMPERRDEIRASWDSLRVALVREPRGHDAIVGAILTPPVSAGAAAGVVFCNDVGYLGMCGHGAIGVVRTLQHLGRIGAGIVRLDTPAGTIAAELHPAGDVSIENVASRCVATDVQLDVPGVGRVSGDIAYGGNWFFLTELAAMRLQLENIPELLRTTLAIRQALADARIVGDGGAPIEHIELSGPPVRADADARNFVLCPGTSYDRSPCGTGTSAKMASLFVRGKLALGTPWRQESIIGSVFTGRLQARGDDLVPTIRGRAFIVAESVLHFEPGDPHRCGFGDGS
jgi:4-hydroxyproline epimerase